MMMHDYKMEDGKGKKALLINPPVYDFAYSNVYNQPDGLLRVATLLKNRNYKTALIDFLADRKMGKIPSVAQAGSPRYKGLERKHFGMSFKAFERELRALPFSPDEVYITSIMTYWWESSRDVIDIVKKVYPSATVLIGGIYPTLCTDHALEHTGADIVVKGEIAEASDLWTDISLYKKASSYAIVNFSRGCPFNCAYCAQRQLNGTGMRYRTPHDIANEIEQKNRLGVKTFWIFSDNFLVGDVFPKVLEEIIRRGLNINISAPKGMEPRLINRSLLELMKKAGWKTINMAFESTNTNVRENSWNRRHNSNNDFARAVDLSSKYGFKHEAGGIVGFVLFGAPDERISDVRETANYLHEQGIFIRPMPFTPVPGTQIYDKYRAYIESKGLRLEDLNEKLYPFADLNNVSLREYVQLHKEMYDLNTKLHRKTRVRLMGAEDILNFRIKIPALSLTPCGCSA